MACSRHLRTASQQDSASSALDPVPAASGSRDDRRNDGLIAPFCMRGNARGYRNDSQSRTSAPLDGCENRVVFIPADSAGATYRFDFSVEANRLFARTFLSHLA